VRSGEQTARSGEETVRSGEETRHATRSSGGGREIVVPSGHDIVIRAPREGAGERVQVRPLMQSLPLQCGGPCGVHRSRVPAPAGEGRWEDHHSPPHEHHGQGARGQRRRFRCARQRQHHAQPESSAPPPSRWFAPTPATCGCCLPATAPLTFCSLDAACRRR
jgi:hypothetical protein